MGSSLPSRTLLSLSSSLMLKKRSPDLLRWIAPSQVGLASHVEVCFNIKHPLPNSIFQGWTNAMTYILAAGEDRQYEVWQNTVEDTTLFVLWIVPKKAIWLIYSLKGMAGFPQVRTSSVSPWGTFKSSLKAHVFPAEVGANLGPSTGEVIDTVALLKLLECLEGR